MQVLIVDDSSLMRHVQAKVLKKMGWDVYLAGTANEALKVLDTLPRCDLLLTDWHMPGMDGMELIGKVRLDKRHNGMRIVLVTSDSVHDSIERAVSVGADHVLMKPFTPEALEERITEVMGA